MRGTNPAWLIPVVNDVQVTAACLSRRFIRQPAEPVVAFVSECVSENGIRQLAADFDQVIFPPGEPPCVGNLEKKDMLLLQSLRLSSFSAVVVVKAGMLGGWSFEQALKKGLVKNEEGDWILVSVSPNPNTYLEAVSALNSGKSFNAQLISDLVALDKDSCGGNEVGYTWSTLKYYNGLRMPLVSLTPEDLSIIQKVIGSEDQITPGFWQKVLLSELKPLIKSDGATGDWIKREDQQRKIAIVGMSCRFPGANSVDEYWQVLSSGLNTATAPPSNRIGKCELREEMMANFLKCPIDAFDAPFFDIPLSTAAAMDPQARLLLEVSWEAFEDAGINPEKLRAAPVGVFYGSWLQEYRDMLNLGEKPEQDFFKKYAGCGFGSAAAKISFFYGFTGPNIATESSCCSSMTAVQLACENLQNGECPLALAAGANVILQMDQHQKVIWAPDGICRSFDSQANGYGRGEGIGVLVLKRYNDAIRDGDRIHGIILGSGISQEGLTPSFATPTVENEARTMRKALLAAQVRPIDVDYLEAHATGTVVGDPIEADAIVKAYSSSIKRQTPLLVGSVKTNIGHCESCSGIASIIKVLLAMKHETIPPHINVKAINPKVNFSSIPAKITLKSEPWKRSAARVRIAGVSNFGISGADAHLIIQEPPRESLGKSCSPKTPLYILTLSAKTDVALEQLTRAFLSRLENAEERLLDITFTANACRAHLLPFRSAFVASTREQLIFQLRNQPPCSHSVPKRKLDVCFICHDLVDDKDFEQYVLLYSYFPAFQISMDVCDNFCKEMASFSPVAYLINNNKKLSSKCTEKKHWDLCTFSVTFSLYKLWESWGVKPSIVLGLNFRELVGAAIAGKLELAQCFQLIMNGEEEVPIKGVGNNGKTNIPYISAKKGMRDLNSEHWKEVCDKKNESQFASSTLETLPGEYDCDIFITLDLEGKLELGQDRKKVLHLPKSAEEGGLSCLFYSLAKLYTNGFPVDWEGFYAHLNCRKVALPHYPFQRKSIWFKKGIPIAAYKNSKEGELDVWQVCWKPATKYQSGGSLMLDFEFTKSPSFISLLRSMERRNVLTTVEAELVNRVDKLCEFFVYKAFHELGWKPKLNEGFLVSELAVECHIAPNFLNAFHHFLSCFEKSGCILISGKRENTTCEVLKLPETREVVENSIAVLIKDLEDYQPIQSIIACASQLAPVMQGKRKGHQILSESGEVSDIVYKSAFYKITGKIGPKVLFEIATRLWHNGEELEQGRKLRILEVGGRTAVFTSEAISLLDEEGIEYSYHFADLSSHFLNKAQSRFPHLIFEILDLERDPLEQGFPAAYFDIVVCFDVLRTTKNLRQSVGHLQMLLRTGGQLLVGETSKPIKEMDVTFGILDDYWHFEDHDIRPTHCTISADQWLNLLEECGFQGPNFKISLVENHRCIVAGTLSHRLQLGDENYQKTWLLLHDMDEKEGWVESVRKRMLECGRNLIFQEISSNGINSEGMNLEGILCFFQGADSLASNNCRSILEPLLHASKSIIEKGSRNSVPKLVVATLGLWMESESQTNPSAATLWGYLRTARMEIPWLTTKLIDLDPDVDLELRVDALVQEIWMADEETEVVCRRGVRFARRLVNVNLEAQTLVEIPSEEGKGNYTIELPKSNLLREIQYVPKKIESLDSDEVIVEVRAAALNFRDVFSVLKPSERFKDLDTIGMDFSGVISSVGSNVTDFKIGMAVAGVCFENSTISRYISCKIQNLVRIPDRVTFSEAATLPVAFVTAWHCLVDVAKASSGQTILIHAASGGVGLVAIQIAKHLGLNIVATAGSQRKRNFLRNIGIHYVYDSRTLEFGQKIKELMNDHGVDIVLNCLTGPGFKETSLEVCKNGGHFVEMSKLDIWEEHEVKARKPGVNYKIVDLSVAEPNLIARLLTNLSKLLGDGSLKPLPYTRFTASRIVYAIQCLQKAKQIGKVIVEMPYFDLELGTFKDMLFNDRSTYLITGGKGAIGLAIAEWMVSHGAKYTVLLGRNPPQEKALELIQKLENNAGAKTVSVEGDVADYDEMNRVLEDIKGNLNLPPLRGIHHCAGVLSDRMIVAQDWANFDYGLNPKVKGVYNLHLLTLETPLEFFVAHSSLMCVFGNLGQSNYTSACLYTEALMESRVANGLPGMSISWGHWDAGLAENMDLETLSAFTIPQGIDALEKFFLENKNAEGAGFIKVPKLCKVFPAYEKTFLESIALPLERNGMEDRHGEKTEDKRESLPELYKKAHGDNEQQQEMIMTFVKNALCDTLGITFEEVGEAVQFSTMGLDSLMSIELYNILQSEMGNIELGYIDMEQQGTANEISFIIKTALDKALA